MHGNKYDPHNRAGRLKTSIRKLKEGEYDVNPENAKVLLAFHRDIMTEGLSTSRVSKLMETLLRIGRMIEKPFEDLTKDDIKDFLIDLEGTKLSEWTKHDYKVAFRRLFKWMKGGNTQYPPEVSWIKVHVRNRNRLPDELLSEEELKSMVAQCCNPRDRAFLECLFETGCRISELLTVQNKNVKFDAYGALMVVDGKTGMRRIRIVASVPSLANWLEHHPVREDPEAYIFVKTRHGTEQLPFRYEYALKIVKRCAEKAGIRKRIHPHLFRHSRATILANRLTEAQMKEYFGWVQASDMAGIYVHMSGRDVDDAILRLHGIKGEEPEKKKVFRPVSCVRCKSENSPSSRFCTKCGCSLDMKVAMEAEGKDKSRDEIFSMLMKDPEFQGMILKKLAESNKEETVEVLQ
ncbi:MAG: site-specific integrase [Candidatus Micrarchaeota archaeon]